MALKPERQQLVQRKLNFKHRLCWVWTISEGGGSCAGAPGRRRPGGLACGCHLLGLKSQLQGREPPEAAPLSGPGPWAGAGARLQDVQPAGWPDHSSAVSCLSPWRGPIVASTARVFRRSHAPAWPSGTYFCLTNYSSEQTLNQERKRQVVPLLPFSFSPFFTGGKHLRRKFVG